MERSRANALPCALSALAGALALLALPSVPSLASVALGAICLGIACARLALRVLYPAAFAAAAFVWTALHAQQVLDRQWPSHAGGNRVLAIATIESIPGRDAYGLRFDAWLRVERPGHARQLRARIVWPQALVEPRAGDRWRLLLTLQPPRARVNPFARDSERQLFRERVHALGRVVPSALNTRLSSGHRNVASLRESIARHIDVAVADRDAAALITALAIGHTSGMSREQWRVFNVTGTAHLVAISGLHVTLFAVVAIGLARLLWRVLPRPTRWPARETFAAMLGLAAASAYAALAGFSIPTQRTLLMLGAWFAARILVRHATLFMPIAAALVAVLVIDPFAPLSAGFWLSFLAMTAIVLATGTRVIASGKVAEAIRVQGVVALALAPATLAWFGGVSLVGIVVNLVAIPVVSFVFVPLILLAVALLPIAPVADALLACATGIYAILWPWLAASADVTHAILFASPDPWWLVGGAAAALLAGLPWPLALRIATVTWLLPLAAHGRDPRADELRLTLLDTGRNSALVAHSTQHVLVRGIGEGFGTAGRSVENVLLPFLRAHRLERIDVLILDRADQQSMAGLNALLANVEVGRILVNPARSDLGASCVRGELWRWGELIWRVRSADCVIEVSLGRTNVTLDQGTAVIAGDGAANIVLVSGRAGRPAGATAPASGGRAEGARVLETYSSGAIMLRVNGAGVETAQELRATRRLWRME